MPDRNLKACSLCKELKETEEFNKNKSKKDGLQSICRNCSNEKSSKYYNANKEKHKKITIERKIKQIRLNQQYVFDYSKSKGCVDCKENEPCCLDFDHVRGIKTSDISKMIHNGCSLTTIMDEIAKCEIRCANCHRRKTAKDFAWYKNIIPGS